MIYKVNLFTTIVLFSIFLHCNHIPFIKNDEKRYDKDLLSILALMSPSDSSMAHSTGGSTTINIDSDGVYRTYRNCPIDGPIDQKNVKTITVGSTTIRGGISQVSANNQDAFLEKRTAGSLDWCILYDSSPDDSGVNSIYFDSTNLLVAFHLTGGNSDLKASTTAFQKSYGSNGGPKISFLAILDLSTGKILRGTFLGTRMDSNSIGRVSGLNINEDGIRLENNSIQLTGEACYDAGTAPNSIAPDASFTGCTKTWWGTFTLDVTELISGRCE